MTARRSAPLAVTAAHTAAVALTLGAVGWTVWAGVVRPGTAAAFGAVIAVGELLRIGQVPSGAYGSDRESAPLATAAALAYALLSPGRYDAPQVLALAVTAALVGALTRAGARALWGDGSVGGPEPAIPPQGSAPGERRPEQVPEQRDGGEGGSPGGPAEGSRRDGAREGGSGDGPAEGSRRDGAKEGGSGDGPAAEGRRDGEEGGLRGGPSAEGRRRHRAGGRGPLSRRTLPVVGWGADTAARRVLALGFAAACSRPLGGGRLATGPGYAVGLLLVLVLTALCDAALAAWLTAARAGHPFPPALRDEVRNLAGIGSTVCAGGVVMALGAAEAGLWALPVVGVPLLLTQMSLRGQAAVRATYRQTIGSLARATEVAGYTPAGHARRVSELATAVGRELGLSARHLMLLEYAALMHDIGQLSLVDPVPGGATEPLDAERQQAIAALGGDVVRLTGAPPEVALIVERQAHPYREQPLAGRIVRAVNAYEDLTGAEAALEQRLAALERLRLATAHDYDPRVVEALTRVLARHPTSAWLDARGDGKDVG
ncbi:hypothetical protein AB0M29_32605 [Streptomyces sp. NPDC051976]|uniref:hypothetical protein n=1 Tax=Streptomyces sp. NPDC051976 TaxID=3154947 RepID=UPI003445164C